MRQALFLIVILTSLSVVYSQHNDPIVTNEGDSIVAAQTPVKNAVKTDVFGWFVGTGVLKYERVFSEKISAQLGFFYSWDFPPNILFRVSDICNSGPGRCPLGPDSYLTGNT